MFLGKWIVVKANIRSKQKGLIKSLFLVSILKRSIIMVKVLVQTQCNIYCSINSKQLESIGKVCSLTNLVYSATGTNVFLSPFFCGIKVIPGAVWADLYSMCCVSHKKGWFLSEFCFSIGLSHSKYSRPATAKVITLRLKGFFLYLKKAICSTSILFFPSALPFQQVRADEMLVQPALCIALQLWVECAAFFIFFF